VVLMDAGYGCNAELRAGIDPLSLRYVAGIMPQTTVWASGTGPLPPKKWSGRGRPPKLIRRDDKHQPIAVKELAFGLQKRDRRCHHQQRRSPSRAGVRTAIKVNGDGRVSF
jgi:SRSO17 transposase